MELSDGTKRGIEIEWLRSLPNSSSSPPLKTTLMIIVPAIVSVVVQKSRSDINQKVLKVMLDLSFDIT